MLKIQLNNQSSQCTPGKPIDGHISWNELTDNTEKIEVRLIWYTSGKGDRDCEILDVSIIENPANSGESPFSFVAPSRPYTFSGKLVSLTWAIEAIVFPAMEAQQSELVISGSGAEIVLDQG